jgi:rfaE bifunctional protein kinase chain/domain
MSETTQKRKVFISGFFNILHPGHLRLFRFAKEQGEHLIVGVFSDRLAAADAHINQDLRLEAVRSNSWVDEVVLIEDSLEKVLTALRPDFVVKGKEHEDRVNPEKAVLESFGAKLIFSSGESVFSSIDLIRKEFERTPWRLDYPSAYCERHEIRKENLRATIGRFSGLRVCVVGDLIVDEYITCQALGMSQEDPTLVVTPIDSTKFVGGAGIVAAHAKGLGADVSFLSVSGADPTKDFALEKLIEFGVQCEFFEDEARPTTLKQRFRSGGKSLLRVSHLRQTAIPAEVQKRIYRSLESKISNLDALVFSDFNYGCLPQQLVESIMKMASRKGLFIAADSQSSSQVGDVSRFRGVNLLNATEREARISTRNHEDGLVVLAEDLRSLSSAENVFLKLGDEGLLIHAKSQNPAQPWLTDRVHALNPNPKDVAGAGDSLLIASAMSLAVRASIWEAAIVGSMAAGIQVGRVGNTPLSSADLMQELSY